ncbi:FdhF/YdeP family oxidoreductase [Subtercola endophyticus]|uniref:FdhF/YdeP family oxidoreductase n=1 Tax=Subtercola endophyticus TaxID=2895559 RepID=UPI001E641477|nr:FdhF/YdeP family oxidoreductase [Subtercola endophyticus]UFS58076.1 FdhF/YdeP family oxidoreductase [Subtercola endophyticus]
MSKKPLNDGSSYPDLEVGHPKHEAVGLPGIFHSMEPALTHLGPARTAKLLTSINQKDGFDCMSCAWPDPDKRKALEFCENGAKAVTWEATPVTVPTTFWAENSLTSLLDKSEYWLGMHGRLTEPVYKRADSDHYEPISWDEAFALIASRLNALPSPDNAAFYTSGRTANETAFAYQLFVRAFGTNNLPDCSNMCHESTGTALGETIGIGKSTIAYDDFEHTDLIIIMGQNPGTNHPRMLTALEDAKKTGATIVAVNPLPEAGLFRYKNPQTARGLIGHGTALADQYLQIRSGGDMALLQAVAKRVLDAEAAAPGTVLDHAFLSSYTLGLEELKAHLANLDEADVLTATGLSSAEIDELADRYIRADRTIITWAMGLTQQKKAVETLRDLINLLLLKGNIGRPGAGASPIRGHSNVQGDRTMGVWEQMSDSFLDKLGAEFEFEPPRKHGTDALQTIEAMQRGDISIFFAMGGNFVGAISDTAAAEAAMRGTSLTVQVSTKLNRSHVVTGSEALILPTLGRTEVDVQATGAQFVSVEDSVCAVHGSHGRIPPVAPGILSEIAIVSRLARATLGAGAGAAAGATAGAAGGGAGAADARGSRIDWKGFEDDYDIIREHISHVVPGFENFNADVRRKGGFILPNGPRDSRTFNTATGKAMITVNHLEPIVRPEGRLILQTMRAHDQFNTTIYSLNDRYRGIKAGRDVVFVNPLDIAELGLADGQRVDIYSEWPGEADRVLPNIRVVSYPTAKGCAAAYYPEANVLIPLASAADRSNTPVSKAILVRLEPVGALVAG